MRPDEFRVSIIITSFNAREYLVDAVESVKTQTLPPHEIIIADDCSSDGSRNAIQSYERRFPSWIKGVYQQKNIGIPGDRNSALRTTHGHW